MKFQTIVEALHKVGVSDEKISDLIMPGTSLHDKIQEALQTDFYSNELLDNFVKSDLFDKKSVDKYFLEILRSKDLDEQEYINYEFDDFSINGLSESEKMKFARYVIRGFLSCKKDDAIIIALDGWITESRMLELIEYTKNLISTIDLNEYSMFYLGRGMASLLHCLDYEDDMFKAVLSLRHCINHEIAHVFVNAIILYGNENMEMATILTSILDCANEGFEISNSSANLIKRKIDYEMCNGTLIEELSSEPDLLRDVLILLKGKHYNYDIDDD
jgi:hypothetical protein